MSDPITCPACATVVTPTVRVGMLAICNACGGSIVINGDGTVRRAVALDVEALTVTDQATLRNARGAIARSEHRR